MSWNYVDVNEPRWDSTRPPPRGLLPVPPEVEELVAWEEAKFLREKNLVMAPEARKRQLDQYTLEYYYDGHDVAFRETPEGIEVLAVGMDEIGQFLRGLSQEEKLKVHVAQG